MTCHRKQKNLARTARIFQAARRTAYQRLKEGVDPSDIDHVLREQFEIDARYARDAAMEAQATGDALCELLPRYLADTEAKISKVEKRLQQRRQKQGPAQTIAGLEHRLAKLKVKQEQWQKHLAEGSLPPVIFGSANAFLARRRGEMTHSEWQARRRAQFWSRGETPRGNQHACITLHGEGFALKLATLPMVKGKLQYFSGNLWVPDHQQDLLRQSLGEAYTVRVLQSQDGWKVHITVREHVMGEMAKQAPADVCVGGLDCNTDCLAVAVASSQGNLLAHKTIWMHDLPDVQANIAEHLISQALELALDFLETQGAKSLVVERLKFAQDHGSQHTFNRRTTRFRSTMVNLAMRKALRRGMKVVQVNPAYSSIIGKYKYADAYGLSVHEAAAFVLARRGQERRENLPKQIVAQFPHLQAHLLTEALTLPTTDKKRHTYERWAYKLSHWKGEHPWSLWFIWDQAAKLIS